MQDSVWWSFPLNSSDTEERKTIDTCGHNSWTHRFPQVPSSCIWPPQPLCLNLNLNLQSQSQPQDSQSLPCYHPLTVVTFIKTTLCLTWGSLSSRSTWPQGDSTGFPEFLWSQSDFKFLLSLWSFRPWPFEPLLLLHRLPGVSAQSIRVSVFTTVFSAQPLEHLFLVLLLKVL